MKTNKKITKPATVANHNGAKVPVLRDNEAKLRRTVMSCMLWENQFYVDGKKIAEVIIDLVSKVKPAVARDIAIEARTDMKLRHAPLLIARAMAKLKSHRGEVENTLKGIIQRPDEMSEFLSLYWANGKEPLAASVKRGLAACFNKFNAFELAKWDKNSAAIKLRDVMFLVHAKPTAEQEATFKQLADGTLETPDTWETSLSAGADKKNTFTRLMNDNKLGAQAFLMNLRNMSDSGVDLGLIELYSENVKVDRVLPFQFISAAKVVPRFEGIIEKMMMRCVADREKLVGRTALMVDISGSMFGTPIARKSQMDRFDAAAALAILCREMCDSVDVYSFSTQLKLVPARRGFALRDAIRNSQGHGGTAMGRSYDELLTMGEYDRIIVITDEQSSDRPKKWHKNTYILNVASYENGIARANEATTITGFSEKVLDFIVEDEKELHVKKEKAEKKNSAMTDMMAEAKEAAKNMSTKDAEAFLSEMEQIIKKHS
ncbi:hypothetical protein RsoM2USA_57 [Ralstonia phage RsoM2USA]|nr:hypothetical protein RsoM2USA_57 [Ralstonia phage RsoM2USA]